MFFFLYFTEDIQAKIATVTIIVKINIISGISRAKSYTGKSIRLIGTLPIPLVWLAPEIEV